MNMIKKNRILGIGVLNYPTTRQALKALCSDVNYELVASVEFEFTNEKWENEIEIFDFSQCIQANYDLTNCSAVGAALLDKLSHCEATYLKMMGRVDYRDKISYESRKYNYLKQVIFWNHTIDRLDLTSVVFFNFPHELYDYVIYCLCKIKGIQTLIFDDFSVLPDTLFLIETIEESCPQIHYWYRRLLLKHKPPKLKKLKKYYEDFHGAKKKHTYPLIVQILEDQKRKERFLGKISLLASKWKIILKNPRLLFDDNFGARWKPSMQYQQRRLFKLYDELAIRKPRLDVKFIYLALHYQPENSSCPMGGCYVDQWLIAEMLAKNLPENFVLYVKEHPLQKKHGRTADLYKHISNLPNTFFVDREYSSFDLIEGSAAVATMTGTAGWEALLNGKPVLKFGHSFYQFAPGVFKISQESDVRSAFDKIVKGFAVSENEILYYLEAIEKASIDGWVLDFIKEPITSLEFDDVCENIKLSLIDKLDKNKEK